MEQHLNWKGILIEPDMESFRELLTKRRHAWTLPLCLGTKPYPTKVLLHLNLQFQMIHECILEPYNELVYLIVLYA